MDENVLMTFNKLLTLRSMLSTMDQLTQQMADFEQRFPDDAATAQLATAQLTSNRTTVDRLATTCYAAVAGYLESTKEAPGGR